MRVHEEGPTIPVIRGTPVPARIRALRTPGAWSTPALRTAVDSIPPPSHPSGEWEAVQYHLRVAFRHFSGKFLDVAPMPPRDEATQHHLAAGQLPPCTVMTRLCQWAKG